MKPVPSGMLSKYALGSTHFAHAIFVDRTDGEMYGWTEHDVSDKIDGFTYQAEDPGLMVDDIVIAAGCDVGNMQITALHAESVFTMADILGGVWRNARFLVFRYWYLDNPITEIDECLSGTFGEIEPRDNTIVIELHDLRRYLNQPVGEARDKNCRYRLGSTSRLNGGLCMKDISAPPFTVPFVVTHVTGTARLVFRDSAFNGMHAADWFGEGYVEFTTGNLAGIQKKVYAYDADGTFTLSLPTFLPIEVGDEGIAVVGCRKRRMEDCFTKFDNVLNFGGEPDSRNVDTLTMPASAQQ